MQLSNNNIDVDVDVLNDYDWHIADLLRDLFEIFDTSTNIFCSVYYDIIQLHILLHDHVREAELVAHTENLKISRHELIQDSSPSQENND